MSWAKGQNTVLARRVVQDGDIFQGIERINETPYVVFLNKSGEKTQKPIRVVWMSANEGATLEHKKAVTHMLIDNNAWDMLIDSV